MRVMDIGIFGKNKILFRDRTAKQFALDSIKGKLDDDGGSESNGGSGQIMAYINDPDGRLCDWGIPRTECYGVRLPFDFAGIGYCFDTSPR